MHAGDWLLGQVPLLLFFGAEHVGKLLVTRKFPRQMVHQFLDGYEFWLLLGAQHDIPPPPLDLDFRPLESNCLRQPDGLAPTVFEKFGSCCHRYKCRYETLSCRGRSPIRASHRQWEGEPPCGLK